MPNDLQSRILEARANAAVRVGDFDSAESLLKKAQELSPETLGPEPLFRLQLMRGDLRGAQQSLKASPIDETTELLQAVLDSKSGRPFPQNLLKIRATTPLGNLYTGLLHIAADDVREGQRRLMTFVASEPAWGIELAADALYSTESVECRMCREQNASTFSGVFPVCRDCNTRLEDPEWQGRLLVEPDAESLRLMKNLSGTETYFSAEDLKNLMPENLRTPAPSTPLLGWKDLEPKLDPESLKLLTQARKAASQNGRARAGTGELGVALFSTEYDQVLHASQERQQEALLEAQSRPEEPGGPEGSDKLLWVLNVAHWFHALSLRQTTDKIGRRDLSMAWDLEGGQPKTYRSSAIVLLLATRSSEDQIELFETLSQQRPESVFLHLLLCQSRPTRYRAPQRQLRLEHELWLIENQPTLRASNLIHTHNRADARAQVEAWAETVRRSPDDTAVLSQAASAFTLGEPDLSLALLDRCLEIEPNRSEWLQKKAHVLSMMSDDHDPEQAQDTAADELAAFEMALENASSPEERGYLLTDIVVSAFDAGEFERAREVANQILKHQSDKSDWNHGNALHKAHTVLGLLALEEQDIQAAKSHLLDSARTAGSPQLNSFGPNMRLAEALLAAEEKQAVLDYFVLCETFWKSPLLEEWRRQIEEGDTPDFNSNLRY